MYTYNRQLRETTQQMSEGVPSETLPTTQPQETVGKSGHPSPAAKGRGKGQSGKVSYNSKIIVF